MEQLEVRATVNGELVAIYIGEGDRRAFKRAASWARRANPGATLTATRKGPTS